MVNDPRVLELLSRYKQLRAQGQTPRPEDLCRACPELLPELRRRLEQLPDTDGGGNRPATDPTMGTLLPDRPEPTPAPIKPRSGGGSGVSSPPRPEVPGYELLGELGRGGMGVVYKARQLNPNRLVALKMILAGGHANEAELTRFRIEAEAVGRLQHPGIVQILEVGDHNGLPYLSLEFCSGGSLADLLDGTPFPVERAARVMEALARAVQTAHKQDIVHRDLKPANVLLTDDGTAKITDFGLAKRLDAATAYTTTGAVMGTPSYMAPEQAAGLSKQIGPATDVYGLGAILYELLTGRAPFKAATAMETMQQVISQEPVAPRLVQPATPRDLETICLKCLQKDPRKRYASAAELAEDLARFRAGKPVQARPVGRTERLWRTCQRNPMVAGLTAATAILLLVVAIVATVAAINFKESATREKEAATRERDQRQQMLMLEVQTRLLKGNYAAALDKVEQHRDDLPESGKKEEQEILKGWRDAARRELQDKNFSAALATSRALLARFPGDAEAGNLRNEAFHNVLRVEVRTLLQQESHADALTIVRKNQAELPENGKALEKEVHADWLAKARRELKNKRFEGAAETVRRLLTAFHDDPEGQDVARQAAHGVVKLQVTRLLKANNFPEAVKTVEGRSAELPQAGADLKGEIRAAWLARAEAASAQQRFEDAVTICNELIASYKEDAEAQKRRAAYAGKIKLLRNEKARALVARAREKEDTAAKLLRAEDPARPLRAEVADKAFPLLKEAEDLWRQAEQPSPPSLRVDLALAAHYKAQPDDPLFQKLATSLLSDEGAERLGFNVYPLLLARAQAQDNTPKGRQAARAAYAELLNLAGKRHAEITSPTGLYDILQSVASALGPVATTDKEGNQLLARCYAGQARILRKHAALKWPFPDPRGKAFELYGKAVDLDPENVQHLIDKTYSRTSLPNPDWNELEASARQATRLASRDFASNGLLGFVLLMQSRQQRDPKAHIHKLEMALQAFQEAVAHATGREDDLSTVLLNRSMASLELGVLVAAKDRDAARKYLLDARANAERAAELKNAYPEYIHETLGNTLEDMGLYLGETDKYADAVMEFGKAVGYRPERPSSRLGRARCAYRLAAAKGKHGSLQEALNDLQSVIDLKPSAPTLAEAHYWQGMIQQLMGNSQLAHQAFAAAVAVADKAKVTDWVAPSLENEADLFLHDAIDLLGRGNPMAALERVDAARKLADRLKARSKAKGAELLGRVHKTRADVLLTQAEDLLTQDGADAQGLQYLAEARQLADALAAQNERIAAARIRGQAFVIEKKPQEAKQAFSEALPADRSRATPAQAALLLARTDFYLSPRCPDNLRPPLRDLIDDADRAAELTSFPTQKANALAVAGAARGAAALDAVGQAAQQTQFRKEAVDKFREAITVAPNHPENWVFRWRLAKELHSLAAGASSPQRREAYREEAIREMTRAIEQAPARHREELVRFKGKLDGGE